MSKHIFVDPSLQTHFDEKGYVTVDFLNPEEVEALSNFYQHTTSSEMKGFHASMFHQSQVYKTTVDQHIRKIVGAKIGQYLHNYYPLYANFMVKEPGKDSEMKIHQDWAYVDESKYSSLAIWFPLINLSPENGALFFIEGNHHIENPIRGMGIACPYEHLEKRLHESFLKEIPLKAGQAIIWHHRLVHWSPPNLSNQRRIAATSILVPQNVDIYHFYRDFNWPQNKAEKFLVDNAFFMNYNIGIRPEAKSLGFVDCAFPKITEKQLHNLQRKEPTSLVQKIKSFFRL